jgi:hypothetical protein
MEYASKSYQNLQSDKCVYAGMLVSGEPIVVISGKVDREDCQWAMAELDEVAASEETGIVIDFSGVTNVPHAWFESQIRRRQRDAQGRFEIRIRESQDFAEQANCDSSISDSEPTRQGWSGWALIRSVMELLRPMRSQPASQ